jgi:preprotein translocase subunit SecB
MSKAAFSIVDYHFKKVILDYSTLNEHETQVAFMPSGIYDESTCKFELEFNTLVFCKGNEDNPIVQVNCLAIFKFNEKTVFSEIPDFFYTNAIAIFFPYIRAYVSLISTQANVRGIILPTFNLSHLGEELKMKTEKK